MNFTEVVTEVARLTSRPDKILDIQREVNAAINFCSIESNFARDLEENSYAINAVNLAQSLPLSGFLRWRKFAYIKPPAVKYYLTQRDPMLVFQNGVEDRNVYYVVGDEVKFSLCSPSATLLIGHFKYPPTLTDASPNYWLLEVSPYMIIHKAAASLFASIGNNTEAASNNAIFSAMLLSAQRDYKYGANYG